MASIACKCGNRLSNSQAPNDIQYHVYSDQEWHKILENDFIELIRFPKPAYDVWRCNNCNRIYIFDEDGKIVRVYFVESDGTGNMVV